MTALLPCPHCAKPNPRVIAVGYGAARVQEAFCDFCGASAPVSVWDQRVEPQTFAHQPNPEHLRAFLSEVKS